MRLIAVAVPVPTLDALTYSVPESLPMPVVGARVLVPLGNRTLTGIVVDLPDSAQVESGASESAVVSSEGGSLPPKDGSLPPKGGSYDGEPGTPNLEPGTANLEPGTPNSEPGTPNTEPGTPNPEPGTPN